MIFKRARSSENRDQAVAHNPANSATVSFDGDRELLHERFKNTLRGFRVARGLNVRSPSRTTGLGPFSEPSACPHSEQNLAFMPAGGTDLGKRYATMLAKARSWTVFMLASEATQGTLHEYELG
jgi:hypothetical protein